MKRLLAVILSLFLALSLVGCVSPKIDDVDLPPIEQPEDEDSIDEVEDEENVEEEDEIIESKEIILDEELRTQNTAHVLTLDVKDYNKFLLELYMTGSYDNPITINYIKLDDTEVDFTTLEGIETAAGKHSSGEFEVALGESSIVLDIHRGTNYSQGFRIKSIGEEVGHLGFSLEGIEKLEISLVFTTTAAKYFENVKIKLEK